MTDYKELNVAILDALRSGKMRVQRWDITKNGSVFNFRRGETDIRHEYSVYSPDETVQISVMENVLQVQVCDRQPLNVSHESLADFDLVTIRQLLEEQYQRDCRATTDIAITGLRNALLETKNND